MAKNNGRKYRLINKMKPWVRYMNGRMEMVGGLAYLMDREDFREIRQELYRDYGIMIQLVM